MYGSWLIVRSIFSVACGLSQDTGVFEETKEPSFTFMSSLAGKILYFLRKTNYWNSSRSPKLGVEFGWLPLAVWLHRSCHFSGEWWILNELQFKWNLHLKFSRAREQYPLSSSGFHTFCTITLAIPSRMFAKSGGRKRDLHVIGAILRCHGLRNVLEIGRVRKNRTHFSVQYISLVTLYQSPYLPQMRDARSK